MSKVDQLASVKEIRKILDPNMLQIDFDIYSMLFSK